MPSKNWAEFQTSKFNFKISKFKFLWFAKSFFFHRRTKFKVIIVWGPLLSMLISQPADACWKSTIETPEQCVKSVQSQQKRHQSDAINVVLVSFLLTLIKVLTLSWCFFIVEFDQVNTDSVLFIGSYCVRLKIERNYFSSVITV